MSFPYDAGLSFVKFLKERGGTRSIDAAFLSPPQSTSEIIHPERYAQRQSQSKKVIPSYDIEIKKESSTVLFSDRMGEFFIQTLLNLYLPYRRSGEIAKNWKDDYLKFSYQSKTKYLLHWKTVWATDESAALFLGALKDVYVKRFSLSPFGELRSFAIPSLGVFTLSRDNGTVDIQIKTD